MRLLTQCVKDIKKAEAGFSVKASAGSIQAQEQQPQQPQHQQQLDTQQPAGHVTDVTAPAAETAATIRDRPSTDVAISTEKADTNERYPAPEDSSEHRRDSGKHRDSSRHSEHGHGERNRTRGWDRHTDDSGHRDDRRRERERERDWDRNRHRERHG